MTSLLAVIARDLGVTPRDLVVSTLQALVVAPVVLAGLVAGMALLIAVVPA